jgi:hypothetical protein
VPWDPHYYLPFAPATGTVPRFELIETCWSLVGPKRQPITCSIYDVDGLGVEVRAGYSFEDFHRAERVPNISAARELADTWRRTQLASGFFSEISCAFRR